MPLHVTESWCENLSLLDYLIETRTVVSEKMAEYYVYTMITRVAVYLASSDLQFEYTVHFFFIFPFRRVEIDVQNGGICT